MTARTKLFIGSIILSVTGVAACGGASTEVEAPRNMAFKDNMGSV